MPQTTPPARRTEEHSPLSPAQHKNARRLAEYVARRQGVKEPLLWYIPSWTRAWPEDAQQQDKRWVSKTARVRHCYPTKELAWQSYRARKYRQAMHHERARIRLEAILEMINDHRHAPEDPRVPVGVFTDGSILRRTLRPARTFL